MQFCLVIEVSSCVLKGRHMLQGCQDVQAPKEHSRWQQGGPSACCASAAQASSTGIKHSRGSLITDAGANFKTAH